MKKKFRIKRNEEFQEILSVKQFLISESFAIYYKPRKLEHTRIGISASKKLGNAVLRNKIKRQVRMMCQEILDFVSDVDIIILVRKKYLANSFEKNQNQLIELMMKINTRRKYEKI